MNVMSFIVLARACAAYDTLKVMKGLQLWTLDTPAPSGCPIL